MEYKIQRRKVFDDGSFGDWKRHSSKVYANITNAFQAQYQLQCNNSKWGFDFELAKMWKYEFRIVERTPTIITSNN